MLAGDVGAEALASLAAQATGMQIDHVTHLSAAGRPGRAAGQKRA